MPKPGDEAVAAEEIRRSVATTRAEGTARLLFVPHVLDFRPPSGRFEALHRWVGRRELARDLEELRAEAGSIDFRHDRCLYQGGGGWKLRFTDCDLVGKPGEWELEWHEGEPGIDDESASWVVALLLGTTGAVKAGGDTLHGASTVFYSATVDYHLAAEHAWCRLLEPFRGQGVDLTGLQVEVWLDPAGRLRRAVVRLPGTSPGDSGMRMELELFDFGAVDGIEMPGPDEIVDIWGEPPTGPDGPDG